MLSAGACVGFGRIHVTGYRPWIILARGENLGAVKPPTASSLVPQSPTTSFDPDVALAIGATLRRYRESACVAQDVLPILAQVDRAFYGKLERGEKQPTLSVLLRIAKALGKTGAELVAAVESQLPMDWRPDVERGSVDSEALSVAMQRAAVRRAAASKRASERKAAAATPLANETIKKPIERMPLSLGLQRTSLPARKSATTK